MTEQIAARVWTDRALANEELAERFLAQWEKSLPRLEFFSLHEPIRRKITAEGEETVVAVWASSSSGIMFRRAAKPKVQVDWSWGKERGRRASPFPWRCTAWMDRSGGPEAAKRILTLLVEIGGAAFGSVTLDSDYRSKHRIEYESRPGVSASQLVGHEPLERRIPGVYWLTWFGDAYRDLIGRSRFEDLPAGTTLERLHNGFLVQAYEDLFKAGTAEALERERAIRAALGETNFFEKSHVDTNELHTPPQVAAEIEAKISEMKATGAKDGHLDVKKRPS